MSTTPKPETAQLLLVIAQLPGIGASRANNLLARFGPDDSMLTADAETLMLVPGIGETLARDIAAQFANRVWMARARHNATEQIERALKLQVSLVTIFDQPYPPLLKEIYDPPPLLFVRGDPEMLSRPSLAVVGTRKATSYGRQATEFICRGMIDSGFTILSGLAYGIDMTAHRTAIDNRGTTIAVLGCGVDTIYTDPVGKVWPKIVEHGAIISEEWIGAAPAPGNFPRRNRLIAGMTPGTLVVESDIKGGSMITASCALEQNREVFAVPGTIFARTSRGTNRLIQQSQAKPVLSAEDILSELLPQGHTKKGLAPDRAPSLLASLNPEELRIIELLEEQALHVDLIAEKTGLPIEALLVNLFELELKRIVIQEAGQIYRNRFSGNR